MSKKGLICLNECGIFNVGGERDVETGYECGRGGTVLGV